MDPWLITLAAVGLLVAGVLGSVTPMVPAGLLSVAGILVYWWGTGYTDPGTLVLLAFVALGLLVLIVDYLAGAIAAKAGGASTLTSLAGALVGFVLLFVLGPLGIFLGIAGTVFVLEVIRGRDRSDSFRTSGYALVGTLGSSLVQFVLTLSMLVGFVLVVIVF